MFWCIDRYGWACGPTDVAGKEGVNKKGTMPISTSKQLPQE